MYQPILRGNLLCLNPLENISDPAIVYSNQLILEILLLNNWKVPLMLSYGGAAQLFTFVASINLVDIDCKELT